MSHYCKFVEVNVHVSHIILHVKRLEFLLCCFILASIAHCSLSANAEAKWREELRQRRANKPFTPIHPRVNINWTDGFVKTTLTHDELVKIEKDELVVTKLIVINRHGHRAPNAPYWEMCPNDAANQDYYDVSDEDLTALGIEQEYNLGVYIRQQYHHFLGYRFNRTLHYFRAVGEPRVLQSAAAVAQGVFPDGYGPSGFLSSRPQFVPIFSDMDTHEYLLDNVPCFRRAEQDSERWLHSNLTDFVNDDNVHQVLSTIKKLCGEYTGKKEEFSYIKTVADGMTFNNDYGRPIIHGKVNAELLFQLRNISITLLMQRLYNADEQQTYTAVDLPRSLLQMLNHTHLASKSEAFDFTDTRQEATFLFVHREALYALGQFFGFEYHVPGLPHGELPVASTLFIEKLMPSKDVYSHDEGKVYIRLTLWTPPGQTSTIPINSCRIPELCEMREFRRIYTSRVKRTGSWEKLCNFTPFEMDHSTDIR